MDSAALEKQIRKNAETQARDMAAGMRELLVLHNSSELGALCKALNLKPLEQDSKDFMIDLIFREAIKGEDKNYAKVLGAIWEGIIIEYLRGLGKDLQRCRNNLRPAVLKHWNRNTLNATSCDGMSATPVFAPYWKREKGNCEVDDKINSFLTTLNEAEQHVKTRERDVRAKANYESIVGFLGEHALQWVFKTSI